MRESVFDDVKIKWDGKDHTVTSDRVMGLIERIEEHISFADLSGTKPKIGKIAGAWAEALRYAGARVTTEEVYAGMFKSATSGQINTAISGLLLIMIPPEALQKKTVNGKGKKPSSPQTTAGTEEN